MTVTPAQKAFEQLDTLERAHLAHAAVADLLLNLIEFGIGSADQQILASRGELALGRFFARDLFALDLDPREQHARERVVDVA